MNKALLLLLLIPVLGSAQPNEPARTAQVAAIDKIAWLAGEWEGSATFDRGPQGKSDVISWERVTRVAGGTALMVLGRHYRRNTDGSRGELVHDAAALISFDDKTGTYRFNSQLSTGQHGAFAAEMQGAIFVWTIETPRGPIRYRIQRDDAGRWSERGEMCPQDAASGAACREFFSMVLARTKPGE